MNAAEIAKKLKEEKAAKKVADDVAARGASQACDASKRQMIGWIEEAFGSFGKKFKVRNEWFAGSDYWTLSRGDKVLVSCVLFYERGTWNPSDDCRGVPYEGWVILVCAGSWPGPSNRSGMGGGITTKDRLNECIARAMEDHV